MRLASAIRLNPSTMKFPTMKKIRAVPMTMSAATCGSVTRRDAKRYVMTIESIVTNPITTKRNGGQLRSFQWSVLHSAKKLNCSESRLIASIQKAYHTSFFHLSTVVLIAPCDRVKIEKIFTNFSVKKGDECADRFFKDGNC